MSARCVSQLFRLGYPNPVRYFFDNILPLVLDVLDGLDAPDALDVLDVLDVLDALDALDAFDVLDALDALDVLDALDALDAIGRNWTHWTHVLDVLGALSSQVILVGLPVMWCPNLILVFLCELGLSSVGPMFDIVGAL